MYGVAVGGMQQEYLSVRSHMKDQQPSYQQLSHLLHHWKVFYLGLQLEDSQIVERRLGDWNLSNEYLLCYGQ